MGEVEGYAGQVLYIDLTREEIRKEPLDMDLAKKHIGGFGLNCRAAWDLLDPNVDPFSPENTIFMGMGPLLGTGAPCASKHSVMTKWPATGAISPGTAGGNFGINVKLSGYDQVITKGKAKKPVYIKIQGDDVEICDAGDLWGKDLYTTTDMLWEKHGRNFSVLAMGETGERLVNASVCLVDKTTTWGKGGLPAIMGSKNLKAFVAYGNKALKIADSKALVAKNAEVVARFRAYPEYQKLVDLGTMDGFGGWADVHGMSTGNWTGRLPTKEAYRLYNTDYYLENIYAGRVADPTCPIGCKDHIKIKKGEYAGSEFYMSSFYGRVVHMASRAQVGSYEKNAKAQQYYNIHGLCIHTFTALIDWAVELYEKGILTKKDTGGVELKHDYETLMYLSEQAVNNEGLGGILGQGFKGAIRDIGRGCEKYAVHVKGTEPLYDPRMNRMSAGEFCQVVNPRGAHAPQAAGVLYMSRDKPSDEYKKWIVDRGATDDAIERTVPRQGYVNFARLCAFNEDWVGFMNSIGMGCVRGRFDNFMKGEDWSEVYKAVTGCDTTIKELRFIARRNWHLLKSLNARIGFARKDDIFPDRWFEPLVTEDRGTLILEDYYGTPLSREDCEKLLDDYYDERGWDIITGLPTVETLVTYGLEDVAEELKELKLIK